MGVEIERKWLLDKPMSGNIKCIEVTDNPDYYKRNYWKKTRLEK